jgi:hypothetical protein
MFAGEFCHEPPSPEAFEQFYIARDFDPFPDTAANKTAA